MNKLILCEGETDAILLSYYLEKTAGWYYSKKAPDGLKIRPFEPNQSTNWYQKNDDRLLICAVGGKDNFKNFFDEKIKFPMMQNAFEKISIVTDRDDREISEIESSASEIFGDITVDLKNSTWVECKYEDSYKMQKIVTVLLTIIPKEHEGALETAMLDAISENEYDRNIVMKTGEFARQMRNEASKYISTDRIQLKAHLGLTWAVQSPEKVFSTIDEQIRSVKWEESSELKKCFAELIKI